MAAALLLGLFGISAASAEQKTKVIIAGTNGVGDTQPMAHEELARRLNELGGWDAVAMVSGEMGGTDDAMEQGMNGVGILVASDPSRLAAYSPGIGLLMMPYQLSDYAQRDNLMETELYKTWVA